MANSKVGDEYKFPEGHKGEIEWVQKDMKMISVKCSKNHVEYTIGKGKKTTERRSLYNKIFLT